jgi:transcriptional regulator with XRE-family HTH domain
MASIVEDESGQGLDLPTLLRLELEARHWTQTDLEREINATAGLTSRWLKGQTRPEPRYCERIAAALDLDVLDVLRVAGYLDPQPPSSTIIDQERHARRRLLTRQFNHLIADVEPAHWSTMLLIVDGWLDGLTSTLRRIERQ